VLSNITSNKKVQHHQPKTNHLLAPVLTPTKPRLCNLKSENIKIISNNINSNNTFIDGFSLTLNFKFVQIEEGLTQTHITGLF